MSNDRNRHEGQENVREGKRAQFTETAAKGASVKMLVLILALAGAAGYLVYANMGGDGAPPARTAEVSTAGPAKAEEVRVPLKDLAAGKAVFFEQKVAGGKQVRFFAVKAADNTYRAALDACEVCFHAKKGYEQKGKDMICRNCGRDFAIAEIGPHNEGGCNPVALTQKVEGDHLVIKAGELEKGASYF